jgi:hypothetical protein
VTAVSHHGSHAGLITRHLAQHAPCGRLDAIIVPTARPSRQLDAAVRLSATLECALLVLSSRDSDPADIARRAAKWGADTVAIDTAGALHRILPAQSLGKYLKTHGFGRFNDLSGKRNLGLLVARALGWAKVLFLDDDIRDVSPADVTALAGLLDTNDAVGLGNSGQRDNSVVCHAHHETGGRQDVFVSGGLLGVSVGSADGFFPDIYNEDWFFLHSVDRIALTGDSCQDPYDPFASPRRAREEELGDCLAEGLYWLRDNAYPVTTVLRPKFWRDYLHARRELIDTVVEKVRRAPQYTQQQRRRREASLAAARATSLRITPELCVQLMRRWRDDVKVWHRLTDQLPAAAAIGDVLRCLEKLTADRQTVDWDGRVHASAPHRAGRTAKPAVRR